MKNKICRLFLTAVMVVACAGMWGCDYLKNDDEPVLLDSGISRGYGFSMVSDTTGLLVVQYYDHYENDLDDWNVCTKIGLRLVGTRGREPNYWEGFSDICAGRKSVYPKIDPLGDSTILYFFSDNDSAVNYFVWKVEREPVKKSAVWVGDYVDVNSSSTIMRTWKNGKLLFKNRDDFALLDTVENTITRVTKEEAGWPDGVEDAQYFGDDLMTLHFVSEDRCDFAILKNSVDTLSVHREDSCPYFVKRDLDFSWKYVVRSEESKFVFSTDSSWRISEKPVAKYKTQHFITP